MEITQIDILFKIEILLEIILIFAEPKNKIYAVIYIH